MCFKLCCDRRGEGGVIKWRENVEERGGGGGSGGAMVTNGGRKLLGGDKKTNKDSLLSTLSLSLSLSLSLPSPPSNNFFRSQKHCVYIYFRKIDILFLFLFFMYLI